MKTLVSISDLTLSPLPGDQPCSAISHCEMSWTIPGTVLEGAWSFGSEVLVCTTEDIPYEEVLHFCLLGADGKILDQIRLGGIYQTGMFALLKTGSATIRFRFFNHAAHELTVSEQPVWRMPFFGDPKGVGRSVGFSKRLLVDRSET
ncbi:hypothetical protein [Roseibium album]|uniref:hypothetical protein n=1 Tax=Roseibium album TaxID=311410 RepID=UPI0024923E5F|nr:hypothetical protein [Roseibium album]